MLRITLGRSVGRSGFAMKSCPPHLLLLSSPPSPLPPMARESETTNVLGPTPSSRSKSSCTSSSRPLLLTLVSFSMNSGRLNAFLSYDIAAVGKAAATKVHFTLHQALEVGVAGYVA